jgi:hypothetical protein
MRGVEKAKIDGARPSLEWMDPRSLVVETDYQRDLAPRSVTMIRKIVANWSWAKIKPAICVKVGNRIAVIDGQHTVIAAVSRGDIEKIPVMIVKADTVKERAAAFISQNRDRLALTPMHLHYAALAAGDEIAVAVDEACRKAKVTILRQSRGLDGKYRVGETFAIGIISTIVAKVGVNAGARVLRVLVDAKRAPLSAHEIRAVRDLLFDPEYKGKFDTYDLVTLIRSRGMEDWRARAQKFIAAGVPRRRATAACWFRELRRGR